MTGPIPALASGRAPAVTVVIPTKDRLAMLGRTFTSIIGQRDVDLRVLIIDDGSSDGTSDRIRQLDIPGVRVIRHDTSLGVSAARNTGIEAADTPWIAWCDDDDRWAPGKLRAQLEALDAQPAARWAACSAVVVDVGDHVVGVERGLQGGSATDLLLGMNAVPAGGSGVLAERALVGETGGFDERLAILADWDLWTRFALTADVAHVDRPLVAYLRHPEAMSRHLVGIEAEIELMRTRYADHRIEHGVALDDLQMLRWTTWQHVRARRTREAMRGYFRMATEHQRPEAVLKALSLVIAPRLARARDGRPIVPDPAWPVSEGRWFEDRSDLLAPFEDR